jgi:hypothetical protein
MVSASLSPIIRPNEMIFAGLHDRAERPDLKLRCPMIEDFTLGSNSLTKIGDPSISTCAVSLYWDGPFHQCAKLMVRPCNQNDNLHNPYATARKATNVSYVNGKPLTETKQLKTGDRIALGMLGRNATKSGMIYEYLIRIDDNDDEDGMDTGSDEDADTTRMNTGTATANSAATPHSTATTIPTAAETVLLHANTTSPPVRSRFGRSKNPSPLTSPSGRKRSVPTDAATPNAAVATVPAASPNAPRPAFVDDLHCPVCLEIQVQAITLVPCGHSLCLSCWNETGRTTCCQCDQAVTAPRYVTAHAMNNVIAGLVATNPALFSRDNVEEYHERLQTIQNENNQKINSSSIGNTANVHIRASRRNSARKTSGAHNHRNRFPTGVASFGAWAQLERRTAFAGPLSTSASALASTSLSSNTATESARGAQLLSSSQRRQHRKRMRLAFDPPPEYQQEQQEQQQQQEQEEDSTAVGGNSAQDAICID